MGFASESNHCSNRCIRTDTKKNSKQRLSDIWIETRIVALQKTTILHSGRILQNVLEV